MGVLEIVRPALLAGVLTIGLVAAATAQEATPGPVAADPAARFPAEIHAGACDELGETVFTLQEAGYGRKATPPAEGPTGADDEEARAGTGTVRHRSMVLL